MSRHSPDDLFHLVRSLSRSERSFIGRYAAGHEHGQSSRYMNLLRQIARQDTYDEHRISGTEKKNLPRLKNYLHRIILDSLESYHADSHIDSRLNKQLNQVQILFERSLIDQAIRLLSRLKKTAYAYEKFTILLTALNLEKKIQGNKLGFEHLSSVAKEEETVLRKLTEFLHMQNLSYEIFASYREAETSRDDAPYQKIERILAQPAMKAETYGSSLLARRFFYHAKSLACLTLQDLGSAYTYRLKELELFESNPAMMREHLRFYQVTLNNMLNICRLTKNKRMFFRCTDALKRLYSDKTIYQTPFLKDHCLATIYSNLIAWHNDRGAFSESIRVIEGMDKEVIYRMPYTYNTKKFYIYCYIALSYFGNQDYAKALHWVNVVLNSDPYGELDADTYSIVKLLNLLIHYELEHFDVLDNQVRSFYYYLRKKKKPLKSEEALVRFIKSLPAMKDIRELKSAFISLRDELTGYLQEVNEANFLFRSKFINWLDSKIQERRFADVVSRG